MGHLTPSNIQKEILERDNAQVVRKRNSQVKFFLCGAVVFLQILKRNFILLSSCYDQS